MLPGDVAFRLHDTYGFPIDLTIELAAEYGVRVDRLGFDDGARRAARAQLASGKKADLAAARGARRAVRRDRSPAPARRSSWATRRPRPPATVVAILRDGTEYQELEATPEVELRAEAGAAAELVLDVTPFYAEGGGQVGDRGVIARAATARTLFDGRRTPRSRCAGLIVHRGTLHGTVAVGEAVTAAVDAERRAATMRNHTGTHLLHRALRNTVGERARQAGSLVTPDYLRFDFPFDRPLTADEKRAIEREVRG